MSDKILIESLNKWMLDEFPFISQQSVSLEDSAVNKLCFFKCKDVISFIVKYVRQRSSVSSIRKCVKAYKNWSNLETPREEETNHAERNKSLLLKQIWDSTAKVSYLKEKVCALENEYINTVKSLKTLSDCVDKDKYIFCLLNQTYHLFQEKIALHNSLTSNIQMIFQEMLCNGDLSSCTFLSYNLDSNQHKACISLSKLHNPQSFIHVQAALTNFKAVSQNGLNTENIKEVLWADIRKMLKSYISKDILLCFQSECHSNMQDFLSFQNNCYNNLKNTNKNISTSSAEIKKLQVQCIKFALDGKKILDRGKFSDATTMSDSNEIIEELSIINQKIQVSAQVSERLKQVKFETEEERRTRCRLFVMEGDINQQISSRITELNRTIAFIQSYVKQNTFMLSNFLDKQMILYDFISEHLQPPKNILNNAKRKLDFDSSLKRANLLLNQTVDNKRVLVKNRKQLLHSMGLQLFENEHILLKNITCSKNDKMDRLVTLHNKIIEKIKVHKMFTFLSSIQFVCCNQKQEEQQILKQWIPKISSILKVHESDLVLSRIESNLADWWQQPAQFVPDIIVKDFTLKQFITHLKL